MAPSNRVPIYEPTNLQFNMTSAPFVNGVHNCPYAYVLKWRAFPLVRGLAFAIGTAYEIMVELDITD